jgi:hypothetical protein
MIFIIGLFVGIAALALVILAVGSRNGDFD